ncbi:hypothetical protein HRR77_004627 [Exophiala dermatitidis]|nr:hypothetical protein HRR77_004627 [Exophiala dermatitidis]KAJ4623135.1 hypothetical protein HRR85_000012 [Exophiala dermatitidis]
MNEGRSRPLGLQRPLRRTLVVNSCSCAEISTTAVRDLLGGNFQAATLMRCPAVLKLQFETAAILFNLQPRRHLGLLARSKPCRPLQYSRHTPVEAAVLLLGSLSRNAEGGGTVAPGGHRKFYPSRMSPRRDSRIRPQRSKKRPLVANKVKRPLRAAGITKNNPQARPAAPKSL